MELKGEREVAMSPELQKRVDAILTTYPALNMFGDILKLLEEQEALVQAKDKALDQAIICGHLRLQSASWEDGEDTGICCDCPEPMLILSESPELLAELRAREDPWEVRTFNAKPQAEAAVQPL